MLLFPCGDHCSSSEISERKGRERFLNWNAHFSEAATAPSLSGVKAARKGKWGFRIRGSATKDTPDTYSLPQKHHKRGSIENPKKAAARRLLLLVQHRSQPANPVTPRVNLHFVTTQSEPGSSRQREPRIGASSYLEHKALIIVRDEVISLKSLPSVPAQIKPNGGPFGPQGATVRTLIVSGVTCVVLGLAQRPPPPPRFICPPEPLLRLCL